MRALLLCLLMACSGAWGLSAAPSDADAQAAHARGSCGTLGPGTGLSPDGRGWIVSMLPGPHEFRMEGGGTVTITARHIPNKVDLNAGQPTYIEAIGPGRLEWKVPGSDWGPVSRFFLYPKY